MNRKTPEYHPRPNVLPYKGLAPHARKLRRAQWVKWPVLAVLFAMILFVVLRFVLTLIMGLLWAPQ